MFSQRAVIDVFHSDAERDAAARRANALRIHGVDAEIIGLEDLRSLVPIVERRIVGFRCSAPTSSIGPALPATMLWPGAMPARRAGLAWT